MTSESTPPPPLTIHDLPPETIEHVFNFAHPFDSADEVTQQARRHFYLDSSLVCREWTSLAQRALRKCMQLSHSTVTMIVESGGAGRYPIVNLRLVNVDSQSNASIGIFLASVSGVRNLELQGCSIEGEWICTENWTHLKFLDLDATILVMTKPSRFPFALKRLGINCRQGRLPENLLVSLSRQISITSLCVELGPAVGILKQLSPLAPRLVWLLVDLVGFNQVEGARVVDGFFERCTQLKDLTLTGRYALSVIHLSSSLQSWTLVRSGWRSVAPLLDVFKSKAAAVSQLQNLIVQGPPTLSNPVEVYRKLWEGWAEIEEICRQQKIKLT